MYVLLKAYSILTLVFICQISYEYNEPYYYAFSEKGIEIRQLRIEHAIQSWHGAWRNISFFEWSRNVVETTKYQELGYSRNSMTCIFPPFSNYWLIAEIIATEEFVQCSYGARTPEFTHEYSAHPWGSYLDSCFHYLEGSTATLFQEIETIGDPPSHYEIINERSAFWQAYVPEDDSIRLYFGTDFFRVSNNGDTIFDTRLSTDSTYWLGWQDYFKSGGLERGDWAVSNVFFVPDPQPPDTINPPISELKFGGYLRRTADGALTDGSNWRPNPTNHDSIIGIVLKTTDKTGEADMRIAYELFEITNKHDFGKTYYSGPDFSIYNPTKGEKSKYIVTKRQLGFRHFFGHEYEFEEGQTFAYPHYHVALDEPVKGDTLWLVAKRSQVHEFVVIPYGVSIHTLRLRGDDDCEYNPNRPWSIRIPPK